MNIKFFPVLDNKYIMAPYDLVMKHQKQAFENHMQNVDRLAEHGGLSMEELYYVLSDKPFGFKTGLTPSSIESWLCEVINEYTKELASKSIEADKLGLRPCILINKQKIEINAYFHKWIEKLQIIDASPLIGGHPSGITNVTVALVEYEDGVIDEWPPKNLRFTDR